MNPLLRFALGALLGLGILGIGVWMSFFPPSGAGWPETPIASWLCMAFWTWLAWFGFVVVAAESLEL